MESREFALEQYDLRASQNCFPVRGSLAVCRSVKIKLWVLVLLFFSLLSALMHRLINWKPRQFATPWTLCGMRRSLTVESRRKTCTAKHSGKCFGGYFLLFVSFLSLSCPADRRLTPACSGFLLISLHLRVFCALFAAFIPSLSLSPCSLPYLLSHISPCPHITPVQKTAALLNSSHPFLFVFPFILSRSLCSSCCDRLRSD